MSVYQPENPLIVQGDHTILVEVDSPLYEKARDALVRFAELIKSPEHIHTYRITPLSMRIFLENFYVQSKSGG